MAESESLTPTKIITLVLQHCSPAPDRFADTDRSLDTADGQKSRENGEFLFRQPNDLHPEPSGRRVPGCPTDVYLGHAGWWSTSTGAPTGESFDEVRRQAGCTARAPYEGARRRARVPGEGASRASTVDKAWGEHWRTP